MIRIALALGLTVSFSNLYAQVLYASYCNEPCDQCVKTKVPIKLTYKADPKTQHVMLVVEHEDGGKDATALKCNVIDKNNWVCPGAVEPESGKHYSVDGIAHRNDISAQWKNFSPDVRKTLGRYACNYRKSVTGKFEVVKETKRW